jgi:23S rRNA pseudouridine1911/1915/1917 synthase
MISSAFLTVCVKEAEAGWRLDQFSSIYLTSHSRTRLANQIRCGNITVNQKIKKPSYKVKLGDVICVRQQLHFPDQAPLKPEAIHLDIINEDSDILVINKPAGLVVHPAPGHSEGTLVNGLLFHYPKIFGVGEAMRPGIVHRLDKDTSGLMVVAKSNAGYHHLAGQFKTRKIKKTYLALVHGVMNMKSGTISLPLGRHPVDRKKISTKSKNVRTAYTTWAVKAVFREASLLEVGLKTGRTHQIRVHCAAIGHPIIGDSIYGGRRNKRQRRTGTGLERAKRQMLHACHLAFIHPAKNEMVYFSAPLPEDMAKLIETLEKSI